MSTDGVFVIIFVAIIAVSVWIGFTISQNVIATDCERHASFYIYDARYSCEMVSEALK